MRGFVLSFVGKFSVNAVADAVGQDIEQRFESHQDETAKNAQQLLTRDRKSVV